jgi:hypothetical protein
MVRRQVRRRRRWQRARIIVLVLSAAVVVVAAAVGIDRLAVVVHRFYAEHHHSSPPQTSGVTHPATTTTATTTPGPPRCGGPQLGAVVSNWRETNATVEETVTLTNISPAPCTLAGYPTVGVGAQNGTPLPAPNVDVATAGSPGAVVTTSPAVAPSPALTLARGDRASFQLSYGSTCDHVLQPGDATTGVPNECYAGLWLEVTPTPGSSPLVVTEPLRLTYATSGFDVAPFQAGNGPPLAG